MEHLFPALLVIFCGSVLFYLAKLFVQWRSLRSQAHPNTLAWFSIQKQFSGFSKLCSLSYKPSSPLPGHEIFPSGSHDLQFQFVGCWTGREKWLWSFALGHHRGLVLVIRGSHLISDWIQDIHLARAVAGVTEAEARFDALVQNHLTQILAILREQQPSERSILFLTGHSAGATICEAVLPRLCEDEWVRERFDVRAVTFDTPGTPQSFRNQYPIPSERLTTLNSTINPVNTLTRPVAGAFYSAGVGSQVTPLLLFRLLVKKTTQSLLNFIGQLFLDNLLTHPMSAIRKEIAKGNFVREEPSNWPLASNWLVGHVARFLQNFGHEPAPEHLPPLPVQGAEPQIHIPPETATETEQATNAVECPPPPETLEEMELNQPFQISPSPTFDYPDWHRFCGMLTGRDIVIPLVGMTTVGKTTTLTLLLGLPYYDPRLITGGGINNSLSIYVGKFADNIYVADFPGVGAARQLTNNHTFIRNTIKELLYEARGIIACIFYIVNDPINNSVALQLINDVRERNLPTLYCHNDRTQNERERNERLTQIRNAIAPDNPNSIELLNYSAAHRDQPEGIEALRRRIEGFVEDNEQEILALRQEQLRQQAAEQAERRMRSLSPIIVKPVAEIVSTAGLAVAVWLPGAAVWGPLMLKSAILPFGAIGLGPALVVGAGVFGVYRLRQRYLSSRRQQFFEEELAPN